MSPYVCASIRYAEQQWVHAPYVRMFVLLHVTWLNLHDVACSARVM